jgi:NADH:ubiquinone oxidoreductase subunit 6 (subunit J)
MDPSSRGRTALLTTLGVLGAIVVVAIASRGPVAAGEGGARGPTQTLVDVLFTLYLLLIAGAVILLVYSFVLRRHLEAIGGADEKR